MIADIILALDVGTSSVKAALFDRDCRLLARAARSYAPQQLAAGGVELDPDLWIDLIASSVDELTGSGVDPNRLAGIGLSARGELAIFLDEAGQVLTPTWLDRRADPVIAALAAMIGEDLDYYYTRRLASRTYFLRQTAPDLFARLDRPLFVRDFVQYRLTGTIATDPSSGPPNGVWPAQLWDAVGFPVERLAPVRPHTDIAGWLTPAVAERLGLPAGLAVGVGGHDGACANAGAGAIRSGQVCLTLGTQGVARAVSSIAPTDVVQRRICPLHFLPAGGAIAGRYSGWRGADASRVAPGRSEPTAWPTDAQHAELTTGAQAIAGPVPVGFSTSRFPLVRSAQNYGSTRELHLSGCQPRPREPTSTVLRSRVSPSPFVRSSSAIGRTAYDWTIFGLVAVAVAIPFGSRSLPTSFGRRSPLSRTTKVYAARPCFSRLAWGGSTRNWPRTRGFERCERSSHHPTRSRMTRCMGAFGEWLMRSTSRPAQDRRKGIRMFSRRKQSPRAAVLRCDLEPRRSHGH